MNADSDEPDEPWHFENRQRKIPFDQNEVRAFLARLFGDLADGASFSVVVSSDAALRSANQRFRRIAEATDVLSFPDGEDNYLGDILISAARAARQAGAHGHTVEQEIQLLVLHGMLHLRGYDHEADSGEMRETEERFRRKYGLTPGLIARDTP